MMTRTSRIKGVISAEIDALNKVKECTTLMPLDELVDLLLCVVKSGGNVFISGVGKCSFVASKLAATYCSLGMPSFYLNCSHAMHGDIGCARKGDVVILLSKSGETNEIVELANACKDLFVTTVSITCCDSTLSKLCDLRIVLPVGCEADNLNLAPTSSTTAFMAFGDALGVVVSYELGFRKEDFHARHKRGRLGELSK